MALPNYITYLTGRMVAPLALVCVTLAGVGWLAQSLRFIDYIINRGLNAGTFLYLSLLVVPSILWVILPIALFISVIYTFHKLATESELIIFRGSGMGSRQLLKPVGAVALATIGLIYLIGLYLLPASYREFKDVQVFIRDNYASLLLQEGVFATPTSGLTVYIRERDKDGTLYGLLVHDSRAEDTTITYMAERGVLQQSASGPRFLLENGNRQEINHSSGQLTLLDFERYSLEFGLFTKTVDQQRWREPQERYITELFFPTDTESEKQYNKLWAEGHHRLSWPLFSLFLALLALTPFFLGQYNRRGHMKKMIITSLIAVATLILELTLTGMAAKYRSVALIMYILPLLGCAAIMRMIHLSGQSLTARPYMLPFPLKPKT